jgi:hypothetical protein
VSRVDAKERISKVLECFLLEIHLNTHKEDIFGKNLAFWGLIELILVMDKVPLGLEFLNPDPS